MNAPGATSQSASIETVESERSPLEIELIESMAALQPIADEWQALLSSSAADCVFLTWDWVRLWWEVFGSRFRLFVLTARRAGQLVGVAPFMIRRTRHFGLPGARVLMMIGQGGGTLAERFAIFAAPGHEAEVTQAFVHRLAGPLGRRWDVLRFERLREDAVSTTSLVEALGDVRLQIERTRDRYAPYANLPATMDAYLAARSSNFRSQYRSSVRKIDRLSNARLLLAGQDIDVHAAMQTLGKLHRSRFDEEASSSFRSSEYVDFHSHLAEILHKRGWLWLGILEADGRPIAARYDFVYGDKVWCMQGGWDPEYAGLRPGMVLTGAVFEWAIGRGLTEYDFLCGDESYKARWSSGERRLIGFRAFNPRTLLGRSLPAIVGIRRLLRGRAMTDTAATAGD